MYVKAGGGPVSRAWDRHLPQAEGRRSRTVMLWCNRFGPMFAAEIRPKRVQPMRQHTRWKEHLDEVYVTPYGRLGPELMPPESAYLTTMPFNPQSSLAKLLAAPVRPGRVTWLGLRPERRAAMVVVQAAELEPGRGLVGDRYKRLDGGRQVTLIGEENLSAIAAFLGQDTPVAPELVRRNIVVAGLNLLALKDQRFRLGQALLETSGECHPCSRMEEVLGVGGYNAMRGQGGVTARVIEGGRVALGDAVVRLDP